MNRITDYFLVITSEIDCDMTTGRIENDDLAKLIVFLIDIKSKSIVNNDAKCLFVNKLISLHVDWYGVVFVAADDTIHMHPCHHGTHMELI